MSRWPSYRRRANQSARIRQIAPLIALAVEAGLIYQMSGYGDFLQAGAAWKFTAFGLAAGVAYWLAARCFVQAGFKARQSLCILWLAAVALRVVISPVAPGDDLWRYRWEGMIQLHGFNPYRASPASPELTGLRGADWSKINHRDYPAIYPPLTEAVFAGLAAVGNARWSYQVLFALADLAGIAVLRRLLARSGAPPEHAVWYAWNPLAIYAFAGAAHFDSLMILALLGAMWALDKGVRVPAQNADPRAASGVPRMGWLSALLLGLAIAVKIAPLVLLPVWAFALGSWRRVALLLPVTLMPLAVSAFAYGFPAVPVFATLQRFGGSFRVNDPVWWLVEAMGWSHPSGNNGLYGACALAICAALAYGFRRDWRRGWLWVWGASLLLSPVVHAWYVLWVLPVAVWRGEGARAWCVFSISTFGYFLLWEVNHSSGKPWVEPPWLRLVILLPPLLTWAWTTFAGVADRTAARKAEAIEFIPREDDAPDE